MILKIKPLTDKVDEKKRFILIGVLIGLTCFLLSELIFGGTFKLLPIFISLTVFLTSFLTMCFALQMRLWIIFLGGLLAGALAGIVLGITSGVISEIGLSRSFEIIPFIIITFGVFVCMQILGGIGGALGGTIFAIIIKIFNNPIGWLMAGIILPLLLGSIPFTVILPLRLTHCQPDCNKETLSSIAICQYDWVNTDFIQANASFRNQQVSNLERISISIESVCVISLLQREIVVTIPNILQQ